MIESCIYRLDRAVFIHAAEELLFVALTSHAFDESPQHFVEATRTKPTSNKDEPRHLMDSWLVSLA
jgi:hypothetical protein